MLCEWILSLIVAAAYGFAILAMGAMVLRRLGHAGDEPRDTLSAIIYGVLLLALIGTLVAAWPAGKKVFAYAVLGLAGIAMLTEVPHRAWYARFVRASFAPVAIWVVSTLVALTISFAPARQPATLFDGPYVFKRWVLPVQIQSLTGHLPADNSLPAVVTEYLARGISFADIRPLMPGQEVSNRPILVGLAAVTVRVILGGSLRKPDPMPRFDYVSTSWPDTLSLVSDFDFRLFLALGITLNALVAVAFYVLLAHFNVRRRFIVAVIFCSLSPYVILHTVFTWPKNLAAFFIIAALILMFCGPRRPIAAGIAFGLAYWSHPLALAFIATFVAYGLWQVFAARQRGEPMRHYAVAASIALLAIALWMFWSHIVMKIPSDLVTQNQNMRLGLLNFIWVRFKNIYTTFAPIALDVFPFNAEHVVTRHLVTIWAPLGFLVFFCTRGFSWAKDRSLHQIGAIAGVAGLALVLVFGTPAVPLLHGWQAVWPVLAVPALVWLGGNDEDGQGYLLEAVLGAQLLLNMAFLTTWGRVYSTL